MFWKERERQDEKNTSAFQFIPKASHTSQRDQEQNLIYNSANLLPFLKSELQYAYLDLTMPRGSVLEVNQ